MSQAQITKRQIYWCEHVVAAAALKKRPLPMENIAVYAWLSPD